jgi:hypothetical protein
MNRHELIRVSCAGGLEACQHIHERLDGRFQAPLGDNFLNAAGMPFVSPDQVAQAQQGPNKMGTCSQAFLHVGFARGRFRLSPLVLGGSLLFKGLNFLIGNFPPVLVR